MTDQTNPATERTGVFISGAGPTGLMAALILAKAGVSTRVIDAKPGPIEQPRALAEQARDLELWHELGLDQHALAGGQHGERRGGAAGALRTQARHSRAAPRWG